MPNIVLYTHRYSPPGKTVQLTAKYIGLDIDYKFIDLLGSEQRKPEFIKINPQHTIPTLDDNGQIIWDSHAISCYLINKYAKNDSLYPKDNYLRARIDQRLHFDSGLLFSKIRQCMTAVLFDGLAEFPEAGLKDIIKAYDFMEIFLKDDRYMVGNQLTLADFACSTTMRALDLVLEIDFVKYPKIKEWLDRLANEIPGYNEIEIETTNEFRPIFLKKYADNKTIAANKK